MTPETLPRGMDYFELDEDGVGIPFEDFQTAIQVWSWMRAGPQATVREAAQTFQVTDEVARKAVDTHEWMFVTGPDDDPSQQFIDHEGF